MNLQSAIETHLRNIEARSGKSLAELTQFVEKSGLSKFGEKREFLKTELGLSHGDANAVINHLVGNTAQAGLNEAVTEIYAGPRAALLSIHEKLMEVMEALGEFETAPKKGYISFRRKKQFAMVGPATKTQVEVGLNAKGLAGSSRLVEQAPGGMCQYKVRIGHIAEIDAELVGWLKAAFDSAG